MKRLITWNPQPDITVYELSMALSVLLPAAVSQATNKPWAPPVDEMPPEVRRHFGVKNEDD